MKVWVVVYTGYEPIDTALIGVFTCERCANKELAKHGERATMLEVETDHVYDSFEMLI